MVSLVSLDGRTALVTGAGRGNGRAIAVGLASAGAAVIVTDVDEGSASESTALIKDLGGRSWSFQLDVASPSACELLATRVAKEVGNIDILVNNAGVLLAGRMDEPGARDRWERTRSINIDGPYNLVAAFLEALKASKGCIVNVGSIQSFVGGSAAVSYVTSKGAILQLTKALAVELAIYGIRVNAIAPGLINTPMTDAVQKSEKALKGILSHVPMRRIGRPEELQGAVVFLASSAASYITGVTLPVDGGYLAV
ncbi:glucose 1-dehydrogenase [Bradyrhizobium sp. 1]|nr:glucose 1-dehydrogenase [Bradyrhizobium sp. 1]